MYINFGPQNGNDDILILPLSFHVLLQILNKYELYQFWFFIE